MSLHAVPRVCCKTALYVLDNSKRHNTNNCPTRCMCLLILFKVNIEVRGKRETFQKFLVQNEAF